MSNPIAKKAEKELNAATTVTQSSVNELKSFMTDSLPWKDILVGMSLMEENLLQVLKTTDDLLEVKEAQGILFALEFIRGYPQRLVNDLENDAIIEEHNYGEGTK